MEKRTPDAPSKPPFLEIKDPILIAKIFDLATRLRPPVTLWLKSRADLKFEATPTSDVRAYKKFIVKYPKDFMVNLLQEALEAQGNAEILGSLPLEGQTLFFRTTCEAPENSRALHLAVPVSLFKVHRRTTQRVPFDRERAPKVTMLDPSKKDDPSRAISRSDLLVFRMLDLSTGGCSVAAKIDDEAKLKVGTVLTDLRFQLGEDEIVVEAAVRSALKTANERGTPMLRVGLEFLRGNSDFRASIKKVVTDESRRLFTLL